jgi:hypothetical protein
MVDVTPVWRSRMQGLMASTCESELIGKGRDAPGLTHTGFEVAKVTRIENSMLWRKFVARRDEVTAGAPGAPTHHHGRTLVKTWKKWMKTDLEQHTPSNEVFHFHGTSPEIVNIIASNGFEERVCSLRGLFGAGIYLAENSSKSDEYCTPSDSGSYFMFLVRATLGTPHLALSPMNNLRRPPCREGGHTDLDGQPCAHPRADSVLAPTKSTHPNAHLQKYREFVIYDRAQCYPEFLIEYKRV